MSIRRFIIAVLLASFYSGLASAGEPVVKGSFHTILILGGNCLTVPATETYLRPGTRLEMRPCQDSPAQLFEWNVITFEIKFNGLCLDAFRIGFGATQAGDPIGLWYCNQSRQQKWFPNRKNESWREAFNIVGGGSPNSKLCLSIAGDKSVDGAQLTIQNCDGGDNQWFRLYSRPPVDGPVSQRENSRSLLALLPTSAAQADERSDPEPTGP